MNLKIRRFIYIIFIFLFFLISSLIIIYALGYKYNWSKRIFERTGIFYIKSFPKNADIYINNKKNKHTTPTQINRLLPNDYQVKISKDGYFDWQKTLPIYPDSTTFIEDVSLFKKNLEPEIIVQGEFINYLQSNNKLFSIVSKKEKIGTSLWLLNLTTNQIIQIYQPKQEQNFQLLSWSNNDQKILLKDKNSFYILIPSQKNKIFSLNEWSKLTLTSLVWDSFNDNVLYTIANQRLYQLDLLQNQTSLLINEPVLAMINYKTDILAIVKKNNQYFLQLIKSVKEPLMSLPYSPNYRFVNPGYNYLSLYNSEQRTLYLLEPDNYSQPLRAVINNVDDFQWHDDQFLFWNNNELWAYYPDVNQKILLERSSQPIIKAFWHPNVVYAFSQTSTKLKIYELDSRDQRNIYDLINFESPNNNQVFINKRGNYLCLLTSINNQSGLYRIEIQ